MNNINSCDVSDQINLETNQNQQNQQNQDNVVQTTIHENSTIVSERNSISPTIDSPPDYSSINHTNSHLNIQNRGRPPTYQDVINMDALSGTVQYNRVVNPLEHRQADFEYNHRGIMYQDIPRSNNVISNELSSRNELKFLFLKLYWVIIMHILKYIFLVWVFINIAAYDSDTYSTGGYVILFILFIALAVESDYIKNVKNEIQDLSISFSTRFQLFIFTFYRLTLLIGLISCSYMNKIIDQEIPIIPQNITKFR